MVCIVRLWYFLIILHARTQEISSGERGGGGWCGPGPSATSFFSHQLNLRSFLKKTIIFQDSREGPTFSGGGGGGGGVVKLYPGGGQSISIVIFLGWVRTPFPPLDPCIKTHSSDVLLMVWRCACHVLWTLSSNNFLCHFFMNL